MYHTPGSQLQCQYAPRGARRKSGVLEAAERPTQSSRHQRMYYNPLCWKTPPLPSCHLCVINTPQTHPPPQVPVVRQGVKHARPERERDRDYTNTPNVERSEHIQSLGFTNFPCSKQCEEQNSQCLIALSNEWVFVNHGVSLDGTDANVLRLAPVGTGTHDVYES